MHNCSAYTGIRMMGEVKDVYIMYKWCKVLLNSWMKEKILSFKIYAVLSNFYEKKEKKNYASGGWKHMSVH
jgi:hypothetical protein